MGNNWWICTGFPLGWWKRSGTRERLVVQRGECTTCHWIFYFKIIDFIIYKFHLKKVMNIYWTLTKNTKRTGLVFLKSGQGTKHHSCCTHPTLWPGWSLLVNQGALWWGPICSLTIFSDAAGSHHQNQSELAFDIKPGCLSEHKAADFILHGKWFVILTSFFSC